MNEALCIGLFLPLLGFIILTASSKFIGRNATQILACSTILISFFCFLSLFFIFNSHEQPPINLALFKWIPVDGINAAFTLHLDPLSIWMSLIITGVGFLIHAYSIGYMDHEEDFVRYFAFLNFFVFCMLLLVLAGDLLVMFIGWEGVGLASYLLIGFWYSNPEAAPAATKAFVMNRIGDLGFLLGILLTLYTFGTSDIANITERVGNEFASGSPVLTAITLLLFIGAIGKSAQLPLYTWLPDAMAGPTPVSALIHAATMVTAGVYLIVRMHAVYILAPTTLNIVGVVGGVTSLFAALCAVGQTDLKRVLAYSTVSQLGLMFLACGVGAFYSAMFHLTTHAFMKALLFLSAGNVVHMMSGNTDMSKMGGLAKKLPITNWLFLIGVLAMSGIPPFAAFFSKDLILEVEHSAGYHVLFYVALVASILTAYYLTRAYILTFTGSPRAERSLFDKVKEAPKVMIIPVSILAILSMLGGFLGFCFDCVPLLERFLSHIGLLASEKEYSTHFEFSKDMLLASIGGLLGVVSAAFIYTRYADRFMQSLPILRKAFYVDEIYNALFVVPLVALSKFVGYVIEPYIIDGSLSGAVSVTQGTSRLMQMVQSGQIRSYAAWMVVGAVALILYFVFQG
ncbi:MAG TPA: NADH-quinone oxidoreductase subunit L [Parachlamydiaceae bacterium]|nr:NADH-quinone oxidoreductase subunit L [Parachlamydiaceae bacterium]